MMNGWIFIVPAMLILAVLLGRYTLRIRIARTDAYSDVVVLMRSFGNVVGLDWQLIGSDSSSRLVLFGKALRVSGTRGESPEATEEGAGREPGSLKRQRRRLAVHGMQKMFKVGWKALVRIVRVFHLEQGGVNIRFGTGDPCTTGILYCLVQIPLALRRKRVEAKVVPDFLNLKLEGEADLIFRFIMLRLVAVMIAAFVRAAVVLRKS
jgi:hypothetical protein